MLRAIHINSVDNNWADALSRSQVDKFLASCPMASRHPTSRDVTPLSTLQVKAHEYFAGGLADSSHRTYNSAQRQFLQFCREFSFDPFPASEETLILFATHLAQRIKPQSITVYLAAVRSLHVAHGLSNPLQPGLKLKQTLRGIERQHFSAPKQKLPLTFDILSAVKPFLNSRSDDDNVKWAALTTDTPRVCTDVVFVRFLPASPSHGSCNFPKWKYIKLPGYGPNI